MHITTIELKTLFKKMYKLVFVVSWAIFFVVFLAFLHSFRQWLIQTRRDQQSLCFAGLFLTKEKYSTHTHTLCPPITSKTCFSTTDSYTKEPLCEQIWSVLKTMSLFWQSDSLLLCNKPRTLIDCVPNNYSVKREALYQAVTQTRECGSRQVVTVGEVSTWSGFNQMYWTLKPLLSNSKRNVVTERSFDTRENPCTT